MPPEITEEWLVKQSPEVQAIIRFLLAQIAELKAENAELKAEIARLKKTPQNSSLPPSSAASACQAAPRPPKSKTHAAASRDIPTRAGTDSRRAMRRGGDAQTRGLPSLRSVR